MEYVNYDSLRELDPELNIDEFDLKIIKNYYQVLLDDSVLTELPWFYHYKDKTNQRGYLVFVNIAWTSEGVHRIAVTGPPAGTKNYWANIPFYREISESKKKDLAPVENNKDEYFQMKPGLPK